MGFYYEKDKRIEELEAEVERLRLHMEGCGRTTYNLAKSAEKAEAALARVKALVSEIRERQSHQTGGCSDGVLVCDEILARLEGKP